MTGKTTYLSRYVENAVGHYGSGGVMVASYTTAAAAEIARRAVLPENNIGTLHKFCYNAIDKPPVAESKAKSIRAWNEYAPAYAMSLPGCSDILNSGFEYGDSATPGDNLMALTTILRNRLVPVEQWPAHARAFLDTWSDWKALEGVIDYTDMLEIALRDTETAPRNPEIIFVDEAQDCTALQFAVIKKWGAHCDRLIMVGDDDQCIYQFAGATPEAFACSDIGPNDQLLEQSYRVPEAVWKYATDWISRVPDRIKKPYLPRADAAGFVKSCPLTWKQGPELVKLIEQVIARYESVIVIASCSYMIDPLRQALLASGIPFHNPYRRIRADWNPLSLSTGTTFAQRLAAFFALDIAYPPRDWWTPDELRAFASVLSAKTCFNKGMKGKLESDNIEKVDLDTLKYYFTNEAMNGIMKSDIDWWQANLVNDEARRKAAYPLKIVDRYGKLYLDAAQSEPAVTIGTIHSVKGGEADVVIIFPDLSQQGMQEWTGKGRSAIRRLMYVGLTRAREGVFVCKAASPYTSDLS